MFLRWKAFIVELKFKNIKRFNKLQNAFKSKEGKQKKTRLPGSRSQDLPTPTQPLIDSQSALIP